MKTVLRNVEGNIEYILYTGRTYLSRGSFDLVMGAEITPEMTKKYTDSPELILSEILNGEADEKLLKLSVLRANGYIIDSKTF